MTGCALDRSAMVFHSVTTAKLPPVRNAVTIASPSLAASSINSILSGPEDLTRKYRALDSPPLIPLRLLVRSLVLAGCFTSLPATASAIGVAIQTSPFDLTCLRPAGISDRRAASASPLQVRVYSQTRWPRLCRPGGDALADRDSRTFSAPKARTPAKAHYPFRRPFVLRGTPRPTGRSAHAPSGAPESGAHGIC